MLYSTCILTRQDIKHQLMHVQWRSSMHWLVVYAALFDPHSMFMPILAVDDLLTQSTRPWTRVELHKPSRLTCYAFSPNSRIALGSWVALIRLTSASEHVTGRRIRFVSYSSMIDALGSRGSVTGRFEGRLLLPTTFSNVTSADKRFGPRADGHLMATAR